MTHEGRRPGDRRVRVERRAPQEFVVRTPKRLRRPPPAALSLLILFAVLIAVGTVLLMLPFADRQRQATRFIDALFTATSAACVTGLVVLDTATHWSPFGQVVIMLLIQAGGFGIMAGSTLLLFLFLPPHDAARPGPGPGVARRHPARHRDDPAQADRHLHHRRARSSAR